VAIYNVNGQEIHTVEAGSPNRQKAILIHGWSSSSYAMDPLMDLLSQRFACVAIDLPGYGKSPPLSKRVKIPDYAELIADLIEQISDGPVVMVGHSMGGMTSITLSLRHSALVERMVLISPTITGRLSTMINSLIAPINIMERVSFGQFLVSAVENAYIGLTDRLMRPVSFADRTEITEDQYARLRADARHPNGGRVRAECFFAMRDNDLSNQLSQVETPTMCIWGAEDNTVPLRDAGVVADFWPSAELRIIPNAGHWPHFEEPATTKRLISSFLGLPLLSDKLHAPVGDGELAQVQESAQFLAHSGIGTGLSLAQRTRLAAQLRQHVHPPYRSIIQPDHDDQEMYIVKAGTVEVWSDPESPGELPKQPQRVASLKPGEMTGELAMIDQGLRTADLISGPEGAVVLSLSRERLLALMEDDPDLGSMLLWNIAQAMSQRVRFILWQLQRANMRARAEQRLWEEERARQFQIKEQQSGQSQQDGPRILT
jgi:pimeloyl-ACP methyl ester carboxylesterase/CRP-like cAMP-binding protein